MSETTNGGSMIEVVSIRLDIEGHAIELSRCVTGSPGDYIPTWSLEPGSAADAPMRESLEAKGLAREGYCLDSRDDNVGILEPTDELLVSIMDLVGRTLSTANS